MARGWELWIPPWPGMLCFSSEEEEIEWDHLAWAAASAGTGETSQTFCGIHVVYLAFQTKLSLKMGKRFDETFHQRPSKKTQEMANMHMKRCSTRYLLKRNFLYSFKELGIVMKPFPSSSE
ncbi:ras-related protein Rab-9A isoform X2 [Nycticebus coucang]|uniref:ras-related protein Rab-9A isoform X2 n=1 Tax=Nycticebus coucang TaxID=9470 RepID=UPI00234D71C1|nr:ras-related protein Rab-9A isoform X2 [Nycticebus coucang]